MSPVLCPSHTIPWDPNSSARLCACLWLSAYLCPPYPDPEETGQSNPNSKRASAGSCQLQLLQHSARDPWGPRHSTRWGPLGLLAPNPPRGCRGPSARKIPARVEKPACKTVCADPPQSTRKGFRLISVPSTDQTSSARRGIRLVVLRAASLPPLPHPPFSLS